MAELINPLVGVPPRDPAAALALGERVFKQITEFPEGHDQSMWERNNMLDENGDVVSCQTMRCVAGWAVVLAGGLIDDRNGNALLVPELEALGLRWAEVDAAAQYLLGLSVPMAQGLFYYYSSESNALAALRAHVERLRAVVTVCAPEPVGVTA